jgi:hypothetical protein
LLPPSFYWKWVFCTWRTKQAQRHKCGIASWVIIEVVWNMHPLCLWQLLKTGYDILGQANEALHIK